MSIRYAVEWWGRGAQRRCVRMLMVGALVVSLGVPVWATGMKSASADLDLVHLFPVAVVSAGVSSLGFRDMSETALLTSGWSPLSPPEGRRTGTWTVGRNAVIDVPLVEVGPLRLTLDLATFDRPKNLPAQRLTVIWNGRAVKVAKLSAERTQLAIQVPTKAQRVGPNRLELKPSYWLQQADPPARNGARRALRVWGLSLEGERQTATPVGAVAEVDDGRIVQSQGSVITYNLFVPAEATVRGALSRPGGKAPVVSAAIYLLDADGVQHRIFYAPRDGESRRDIVTDLAEWQGQPVALTLAVGQSPGGSEDETAGAVWEDLRVAGTRSVPAGDGIDAMRGRYNVLFILLDTLRADSIEPYGSTRVRTPRLRRLAESGVTFTNAFSQSSFTRSSVASLFTSLYPIVHQVMTREDSLPSTLPGLPHLLNEQGYATLAVINNSHVGVKFGFGHGFDEVAEVYADGARGEMRKQGGPRGQAQYSWSKYVQPFLDGHPGEPFFVYLHEIDPHGPYLPMPPYDRMYDFGYTGRLSSHSQVLRAINQGRVEADDQDVRYLLSQYQGEISFMDEYVGWIVDHLDEAGLAAETLVVLLSDHGEEFMEHGRLTHMVSVYDEVLRVPLMFSLPGVLPAGRRPESTVELVDVAPTVLDLLGVEVPSSAQGRSALPRLSVADSFRSQRPAFARVSVGQWRRSAVRRGDYKLIREERVESRLPTRYRLYDLSRDPGESVDRWAAEPRYGAALAQLLRAHDLEPGVAASDPPARIELDDLDPKIRENMRMLGYIE